MAFQQVGVQAVIEGLGTFRSGGREMNDVLRQVGQTAEATGKKATGLSAALGPLGGFLERVGTIAAGILAARLFQNMASAASDLAREMFGAAAALQALEVRLGGIIAREIRQNNQIDTFIGNMSDALRLTDRQERVLTRLRTTYDQLTAEIERVEAAGNQETAYYAMLQERLEGVESRIRGLVGVSLEGRGALTDMATGTLTMGEALSRARGPAADLLDWMARLAAKSPFSVQTIATTFTLGAALGFTSEEMKRLTTTVGDFTAFMGLEDEVMIRVLYNFGQMKAAGKVTGTELRDLARGAMFPVTDVLKRMQENLGMTNISFDTFRKLAGAGKVPVEAFFEAFQQISEEDLAGAMERLSQTWLGMTNRVTTFKQLLGRGLFGPLIDEIVRVVNPIIDTLLSEEVQGHLEEMGRRIGSAFRGVWEAITEDLLPAIGNLFETLGIHLPTIEEVETALTNMATGARDGIRDLSKWINDELIPALNDVKAWVAENSTMVLAFFLALAGTAVLLGVQALAKGIFTLAVNLAIMGLTALPVLALVGALALLFAAFEKFGGPAITAAQQLFLGFGLVFWQTLTKASLAAGQLLVIIGFELNKFFTVTIPGWLVSLRAAGNTIATAITEWIQTNFIDKITGFVGQASGAGRRIVEGLIAGVRAMGTRLTGALKKIVQDAIAAIRRLLGLDSPSKLFFEIGLDTMAGYTKGIVESAAGPAMAAQAAGQAVAAGAVAGAGGDTYNYNFAVNANYSRTQLPITLAQDLQALIGMARA